MALKKDHSCCWLPGQKASSPRAACSSAFACESAHLCNVLQVPHCALLFHGAQALAVDLRTRLVFSQLVMWVANLASDTTQDVSGIKQGGTNALRSTHCARITTLHLQHKRSQPCAYAEVPRECTHVRCVRESRIAHDCVCDSPQVKQAASTGRSEDVAGHLKGADVAAAQAAAQALTDMVVLALAAAKAWLESLHAKGEDGGSSSVGARVRVNGPCCVSRRVCIFSARHCLDCVFSA